MIRAQLVRSVLPFFSLLLVASCGASVTVVEKTHEPTAQAEVMPKPTFRRTHVLRGPEGVRVSIAEFGEDETLFLISGARSDMEGYALRGKVIDQGNGDLRYTTQWDGSEWYPIHKNARHGEAQWKLYGTGDRNGLTLEYDEALSQSLDTDALYNKHAEQTRAGTLAKLQSFNREASQSRTDEALATELKRTQEECAATPTWTTDWSSISDEVLKKFSIASYCGNVLGALRNVCRYQPGKDFVSKHIERIKCSWGSELNTTLESKTLLWTAAEDSNLEQKARDALLSMPLEGERSLDEAIQLAKTDVCQSSDGEHFLAVHPHEQGRMLGVSYGTEKKLYHSPQPYDLGRGWFFDPRQFRKQNNDNFRGRNLRYYANVSVDEEAQTCTLRCGERESNWTLLSADKAREVLSNAKAEPAPFDREPYALARDSRGTYYYVDRGNSEETQRDFRIYKGPRGRLKRLEMRDVASDSEGEVFSTEGGELRLLVEKDGANWVHGKKSQKLRRIPVHENYRLIMNELGVYLGKRFELPCDDY